MKIITIAGPNGCGKTLYVEQMRRQMASDSVRYIAFCDSYGAKTDRAYYLQQRWNHHDIDEETPTVRQSLERASSNSPQGDADRLVEMMGLTDSLDKYVIQLSSGELRKLQLVKTLLSRPRTLIVDNPFIGLDPAARQQLKDLFRQLAENEDITIYLVVARQSDIPEDAEVWSQRGVNVSEREVIVSEREVKGSERGVKGSEGGVKGSEGEVKGTTLPAQNTIATIPDASASGANWKGRTSPPLPVVELRHVTIRYGSHTILNDINWTILQGEHWALTGRNGSGKSTLLSLICADNPQAYACDISLFGRRRGTGESIWDIKRRIGYVSPEMHRSYQRNLPAIQVVASGLKDTVGLYTRPNEQEKAQCRSAMQRFGIGNMADRPFLTLSSGEQRLVLLARAFVKDPDLLILDEPLHGLDDRNSAMVKAIIEDYCSRPENTLIMVSHYEEELPPSINRRKNLSPSPHLGGIQRGTEASLRG